jgi:two-component system CheB/CheR fusion protein
MISLGEAAMTRKQDEVRKPAGKGQPPPASPTSPFPIVGIGASAGGLAAFGAFFSGMPPDRDPGMAFVLVQHLAPDHKSILTELIRRHTRMEVFEVEDGMVVRPNCAYIIPPGRDMAFLDGALQLLEPAAPRGHRLPIDFFFRSLAQDQRERAIGVILSGTGGDGTLGVRAIKAGGGLVLVQSPGSSEFDGMPRSAIATGLVDFELAPADMPARLIAYARHAFGAPPSHDNAPPVGTENALKKVFVLLRAQTGHDFSQYKPSTIQRRIQRRMALHQIDGLNNYVKFLNQTPSEAQALFSDLLIGVTHFFRDPEAFLALEAQLPRLFEGKLPGGAIRVWCPGCSTGEEAYALGILLQERLEALKRGYTLQVFATDLDARAIASARSGCYPASIAADLSPERLARFFSLEADGVSYRINKNIRDLLVFSEQSLIKDPPFSRLDLISCRNLLIYMGGDMQKKIIPLFHYALNPGGLLFLGSSETVGDHGELFETLDRKARLFRRKENPQDQRRPGPAPLVPPPAAVPPPRFPGDPAMPVKTPLRELTERTLLRQLAPASALVNRQGDILYLHGRTGRFLEPATGEVGLYNILKMAREGLQQELAIALRQAGETQAPVRRPGLQVGGDGHRATVNLGVCPAQPEQPLAEPLFLVTLEEVPEAEPSPGAATTHGSAADARIAALSLELQAKEAYLKTANEELETSNEELKSSNEEMQSVNEELQSTNEELETSKEELQSVNEEMTTINNELQAKVADLSRANNDMNNLLAGTGIGTVFVDHDLRILRFTPTASQIINLIPGDVGRPVAHLVSNMVDYNALEADAKAVLDTLVPKEVDVRTANGRCYTMRIQPYRTLENLTEGAVITFVDITEMERTRASLRQANDLLRLAVVVRDAHDAVTVQDLSGRLLAWNPGAERLYGWSEAEALSMNTRERIPTGLRAEAQARVDRLSRAEILEPYDSLRIAKNGAILEVTIVATALVDAAGVCFAVATTERSREAVPHA